MKHTNINRASKVWLVIALVVLGFGLTGCQNSSERRIDQQPVKLTALRSATDAIKAVDAGLAAQLLEMTVGIENSLDRGDNAGATKTLQSLAHKVFTTSQDTVPVELLIPAMDAVVQTQDRFDLPAGTKAHPGHYCRRTGKNTGVCTERNPNDKCFTIDSIPDGCLGTP